MIRRKAPAISSLLFRLLLSCNVLHIAFAGYLTTPTLLWTHQLEGGGTLFGGRNLRENNAVVVTPDGNHVVITADDGTLHIVDSKTPSISAVFEPSTSTGTYREGRTGVAFVMENSTSSVVNSVVYAVIDTPEQVGVVYVETSGELVNTTTAPMGDAFYSRVFGVDLTGNLLWGVYVPGSVSGTPVVSTDQEKIFVAHNFDVGSGDSQGYITVISKSGQLMGSVVNERVAPFGPPAIQSISGNHDMIIVAESWNDGYGEGQGQIQLLVPSDQYDANNGIGTPSYQWVVFSDWKLPSVARPLVKDSLLWVAGQGSAVAGWTRKTSLLTAATGNSTSETSPTWKTALQPSERNVTQPLGSAPVISSDNTRLYLNGASIDFFCIDAKTGKMLWNDTSGFSSHTAEPKLSEISGQNAVVYAVETLTGTVKQFDAKSGNLNWAIGCDIITNIQNCANAVEAEFSISSDGNELYFGDIFGNIYALQVADFSTTAPTGVPTSAPTSVSPPSKAPIQVTSSPSPAPTATPVSPAPVTAPVAPEPVAPAPVAPAPVAPAPVAPAPSAVPQAAPTGPYSNLTSASAQGIDHSQSSESKLPAILGSVVAILAFFAIIAGLFVYRNRSRRNAELDVERQEKEERWRQERAEYEEECRRNEEEEILEIVAATTVLPAAGAIMTSPTKDKKRRRKGKRAKSLTAPLTPSTLTSIEETPDEIDSIGSDPRGRPPRGSRSRSLDRLLAKLMRVKSDRPPIRNLETAFECAAEEEVLADTSMEEQQDVPEQGEHRPEQADSPAEQADQRAEQTVQLAEQTVHLAELSHQDEVEVVHGDIENDLLVDHDDVDAEPRLPRGARSHSVGPGFENAHLERVNQRPPRGHRSQSLERILGTLTGIKTIISGQKTTSAPAIPEGPPTPVRSNTVTSIMSEDHVAEQTESYRDLEGRFSPVHVFEDNLDYADKQPTTKMRSDSDSEQGNLNYISQYTVEPERVKSPSANETNRSASDPISPIHSVGSSSNGRGRPTMAGSRGSSMSPTNSCRSTSSFSFEAYSLPGEDHSVSAVSTGSGITEEQLMIRRRDIENRRSFEPVRPSPSLGDDDRPGRSLRLSSPPSGSEQPSSVPVHSSNPRTMYIASSKQSDALFPQLPGQKNVQTPEDLLSLDSSLYLEDSRSQGGASPATVEQPGSLLSNGSPPRSPEPDAIFPQLPGQKKTPNRSDLISLDSASLYLDDNSVSLSAITFEREKDDASVFSDAFQPSIRTAEQEVKRPKPTLAPPEGVDEIEEDRIPPGSHYVRPPQAPGQTSQEISKSTLTRKPIASEKTTSREANLPGIDVSASANRYNRSLRKHTSVSSHRSRDVSNEQPSTRLRSSIAGARPQGSAFEIAERRSTSVAGGRSRSGTHESANGNVHADPNEQDELMTLRSGNSMLDRMRATSRDRPQRGVSTGAETRYSNSETSGEGSDFAVAETPKRSRRTASIPPKAGVVTDSWSKFLKDLAKAERAFFYPSMDVSSPTTIKEVVDDASEGEVMPPPPPPSSPPPPAPPLLPRPVGEDTRRRLV